MWQNGLLDCVAMESSEKQWWIQMIITKKKNVIYCIYIYAK